MAAGRPNDLLLKARGLCFRTSRRIPSRNWRRRSAQKAQRLRATSPTKACPNRLVKLAVTRFGKLDIAVNNAGVAQSFLKLPHIPSEEARRIIEVDLLGVFYALKHQIPVMEEQHRANGHGGTIVNIASFAGLAGAARLSIYSAAKHGVIGLTRSAAAEYASKGIRVNAVCPSYAKTKMVSDFFKLAGRGQVELAAELTRGGPMRRFAEIDEVVEVILFAADPKNSFMTGSTLCVDGGITAV